MSKTLLTTLTLLLIAQLSIAQTNPTIPDSIPITLTDYNNISIQAILNDMDTLQLMLHTAVNSLSLTKEATAKMRSIKFSAADSVQSWGGTSESRYSEDNSLEMGSFHWEEVGIWESAHSGHGTDGKFGLNLFEGKIVELNIEQGYMVVHSSLPEQMDGYVQAEIQHEHGFMFIDGTCKIGEEAYKNRFLIHSGYSGSILLDDAFVAEHGIGEQVESIRESILKDSYGNELKTIHAILPAFQLAGIEFTEVPIGFFEGAIGRQKMSVLGGDMLKRFNVIFDLGQGHMYVQPNQLLGIPYSTN